METFEQLSDQYEQMIYKIIHLLHIYKNQDDFFQEGLVALWEASNNYNPSKGYFGRYAYVYITGKIKDELRREKRREDRNIHAGDEFWENIKEPVTLDPFGDVPFPTIICSLTDNQRKWLNYTYFDHLKTREIAEKEQVSISTVKAWKAGVRMKLRMAIEK